MNFEVMFFDLDDTLYPFTSGVWNAVADKMNLYRNSTSDEFCHHFHPGGVMVVVERT